jgi:protocatechuate 3,4-dioxygenase beta subunit
VSELGAGEEAGIVLVHDVAAAAVQSAASYAAGFEAGSADVRDLATALRRSGGTAVVTGRVTGPDGHPVPGAIVRLNPVAPGPPPRVAPSGGDGGFQFSEVVAGTYQVAVTRNGFITGEYGQSRAGEAGSVLTLRDRQRVDRLDLVLHRGAVVSGTVSDMNGEPLEGIAMQVWRARSRDGRQVAEVVNDAPLRHTDDRGRYRIHGLQPGSYYVVASEDLGPPTAGPRAGLPSAPRIFYPAASTLAHASVVRVDAGVDATGADLTFVPAPTFRISGYALDSEGEPVSWPVALLGSGRGGAVVPPPLSAPVDIDGAFEFTDIPPGQYVLQAFQLSGRELAIAFVDVTDGEIGPVRLTAARPASLSGRISLKGGPPDAAVSNVRIDVLPADPDYFTNAVPRPWVFVAKRDGTFELGGLFGALRFVTASTPAGWWLESVTIGGVNAADEPVTLAGPGDSRSGVEVVLSSDAAEVSGRVVDDRNEPIGTFAAVAFPVDRQRWYAGSRYVKSARPDGESRFRLLSLPPGDYWVAAIAALPDAVLQDVDLLTRLSTVARRVTLSAGQRLVTDLPLLRVQP